MQCDIKKESTLREAKFEDERAVQVLCHRNGLDGEQSEFAWQQLWSDNPFYRKDWPLGWVLEANKEIVGYIGNVPRSYSYGGKQLIVGAARAFVVDVDFRSNSLQLLATFFSRNPADVFLFSSANELAAPLYRIAGAKMLPQENYNLSLIWVVSGIDFVSSVLRKKGYGENIAKIAGRIMGPSFAIESTVKQRWKLYSNHNVELLHPSEISSEFVTFWEALVNEKSDCFIARRDGASLKWQFGHPAAAYRQPIILCSTTNGGLRGYAILTRWDSPAFGLKRIMVTDLIVLDNDEDVIRDLVAAAFRRARDERVHMLQMMGFPPLIRKIIEVFRPIKQRSPSHSFLYFAKDADVAAGLARPEAWYASVMDGDTTI
ncbi:MAG: hypothetical protein KAV87_00235 [Desulfobacteraceae bacterium]|nr:hypothetical protein [Desulfobacteraceae bacterium]